MTDSGSGTNTQRDLTRTVLAVLLMAILIGASFWVLRPFLLSIVWAAMIVVATWPMMLKLQHRLRSRALAVTIMSGAMVLVFVVPLVLAIQALVDNADTIKGWIDTLATAPIPPPPEWLSRIPLVGHEDRRDSGRASRRPARRTSSRALRLMRPLPRSGWPARSAASACWPSSFC